MIRPAPESEFRDRFRGQVPTPVDGTYHGTGRVYKAMISRMRRAIVRCADAADVTIALSPSRTQCAFPCAVTPNAAGLGVCYDGWSSISPDVPTWMWSSPDRWCARAWGDLGSPNVSPAAISAGV
jgi:hypothetical protein